MDLGRLDLSDLRDHAVQAPLDPAVREGHRDLSAHLVLREILAQAALLAIGELLDLSGHPALRVISAPAEKVGQAALSDPPAQQGIKVR